MFPTRVSALYPIGFYEGINQNCPLNSWLSFFFRWGSFHHSCVYFQQGSQLFSLLLWQFSAAVSGITPWAAQISEALTRSSAATPPDSKTGSLQQLLRAALCGTVLHKCTSEGASSNCFMLTLKGNRSLGHQLFLFSLSSWKISLLTILDMWKRIWHIYKLPTDHKFCKLVKVLYGGSVS